MMPCSCALASPRATWVAMSRGSSTGGGARARASGAPAGDRGGDAGGLLGGQGAAGNQTLEALTFIAGHGEKEKPVLALPDLQDRAEIGVVQSRGSSGLGQKPRLGGRVADQLRSQEFQRDSAAEAGVLRLIDLAHATAAQQLSDPEVGDR